MKTDRDMQLYLVSNPEKFTRYEDHLAAIEIQLFELIENARKADQDPIGMIEELLSTTYLMGDSTEEIAGFVISSPQMLHAMSGLKSNWDSFDSSLPEDSLVYGGANTGQVAAIYSETTLETYLQALAAAYE